VSLSTRWRGPNCQTRVVTSLLLTTSNGPGPMRSVSVTARRSQTRLSMFAPFALKQSQVPSATSWTCICGMPENCTLSAGSSFVERQDGFGCRILCAFCKGSEFRVKVTLLTASSKASHPPVVQAVEQPLLSDKLCPSCRFAILSDSVSPWTKEPSSSFAPLP
jgi:hypothetical protein